MQDYLKYKGEFSNLTQEELIELYKKLENYKIKYRNHLGVPENISFGVEIEFQNTSLDVVKKSLKNEDEYKFWCIHEDASVEEYINGILVGGEISSDILYDTKDNWEKLKKLLNILKGLKAKAGDKTAFHTHVGAQIFKEDLEYAKRFIKLWCIFEDVIYRFGYGISSNPRELIEYYAYPIMPLYKKLYEKNKYIFDHITTTKMLDFGKSKGISFKNYHYLNMEEEINNTIEIRCPNGTLTPVTVQNNINFFLKLMLYVTSEKYDDKLVNKLFKDEEAKSLKEYSKLNIKKAIFLSDLIFNNSLDKINFIKQYIKKDDYILLR